MRITACSGINYGKGMTHKALPKTKVVSPMISDTVKEPDYGKNLKQLSYVIGVSMLGVASIILGTRGKICGLKM